MKWMVLPVIGAALMVSGQEAKPHGDTHKRNATTESRDAPDTTGQTVVIDQQTPQRQKDDHAQQSKYSFRELLLPQNLPNVALVVVGIIGIVVAVCSLRKVEKQITEMRRQVDVTLGQLRAMHEQITEMSEQTTLLDQYVQATNEGVSVARESADAARESIILTHRPRIAVRGVILAWKPILTRMTCVERLNENRFDDGQLGGAFYIVNTGNQLATVIQLEMYLSVDEYLPMEHPCESAINRETVNIKLAAGAACKLPFVPTAITSGDRNKTINLGASMYAIGKITYTDGLGNRRETGFCRQLDYARGKLVAVQDPDYEYTD